MFTFEPAPPMYSINSVHRFYFSGTIFLNYLERVGVDHSAPSGTPEGLCRQVNPGQALSGLLVFALRVCKHRWQVLPYALSQCVTMRQRI